MIGIASDHRGYKLKEEIKSFLTTNNVEFIDYGPDNEDRVDALDYAKVVCEEIQNGVCDKGILICGTGLAMNIIANKHQGIMATPIYNELLAHRSREHNESNVAILGAEINDTTTNLINLAIWLNEKPLGGKYSERVEQIKFWEAHK